MFTLSFGGYHHSSMEKSSACTCARTQQNKIKKKNKKAPGFEFAIHPAVFEPRLGYFHLSPNCPRAVWPSLASHHSAMQEFGLKLTFQFLSDPTKVLGLTIGDIEATLGSMHLYIHVYNTGSSYFVPQGFLGYGWKPPTQSIVQSLPNGFCTLIQRKLNPRYTVYGGLP